MATGWHIPEFSEIEKSLNTDLSEGLSAREASQRLEKETRLEGGRKSLFVAPKSSALKGFLSFASAPFAILLAIVSLMMVIIAYASDDKSGLILGLSVLVVVVASVIVGGFLIGNARKRLESMGEYASPMVRVKRGGNLLYTDGRNVVAGDVIYLNAGDLLPCDARIIKGDGIVVEELIADANGTVGRRRVEKRADAVYTEEDGVTSPDASNMLYSGTAILSGRAIVVACATGANVYLADYLPDGALGGRDTEPEAIKKMRPTMYKISFISASALLILSLIGLLTLRGKESFICIFTMLLSAIAYLTVDLPINGTVQILSSYIKKLSVKKSAKTKRDNTAAIRNVRALDTLSGVTDLVLVGSAGLGEGVFRLSSALTADGILQEVTPETGAGNRLLTLIHTYSKALRESGVENGFVENGYLDTITAHLKNCGFDVNGANLATKSLYFAADGNRGNGYACAETESEMYRTSLFFSEDTFISCKHIREAGRVREFYSYDLESIANFRANAYANGAKCLYVVSEQDGRMIFEGIVALEQRSESEFAEVLPKINKLNVKVTVLLGKESAQTTRILEDPDLAPLFNGEIAFASTLAKNQESITDRIGSYCAYVGFTAEEYARLLTEMRKNGAKIASYGISNEYNGILSHADITVSCDVVKYSNDKYRHAFYEKMPPEGKETNVRCSQQTRLLSKVIVRRFNENCGGVSAIYNALKMSRGAYVAVAESVLLFVMLMTSLVTFGAMSVLTGNMLLDPLQAAVMSAVIAIVSMTAFADADQKSSILAQNRDFTLYPIDLIKESLPGVLLRAGVAAASAIAIRILDAVGVFGEDASYTLPVFVCLILTGFAEVFLINRRFTEKGEGRANCYLKVLAAYVILLSVCAVSTQKPFVDVFFENGFGDMEFLIVPAYILLYVVALLIENFIKKRKNH